MCEHFPRYATNVFLPPRENKIDESKEVILIAKTVESKYQGLEDEVHKVHSYDVPCVIAIPTAHVSKRYHDWLVGEINE